MRNNSAEDTSPVTSKEGNHKLSVLRVLFSRFGEHVSVKGSNSLFKSDELNDGVRDLSSPKGIDALVEAVPAFSLHDLWPSLSGSLREGTGIRCLHSDFELKGNVIRIKFLRKFGAKELYLLLPRVRVQCQR